MTCLHGNENCPNARCREDATEARAAAHVHRLVGEGFFQHLKENAGQQIKLPVHLDHPIYSFLVTGIWPVERVSKAELMALYPEEPADD